MIVHRLAAKRGYRTPREFLRGVTSTELTELLAVEQIDPSSEERADLRTAIIASLLYNANRAPYSPPRNPQDFMPYRYKPQQTQEEMWRVIRDIFG